MNYYRKKYLCVCDGQQEELYLNHVASLIKIFPQRVVTFDTLCGSAQRLKKCYEDCDYAALFDHDFKRDEFRKNLKMCDELQKIRKQTKRKKGSKIYHAYSNVNFDLWLILHKEEFNKTVCNTNDYVDDVRRIYGLNLTDNIKKEKVIKKILEQITLTDIKSAIDRADKIRKSKLSTDKILIGSTVCYANPDFSIQDFLREVLSDCGEL